MHRFWDSNDTDGKNLNLILTQDSLMTKKLTKISTLKDIRGCCNSDLTDGFDALGTQIVLSYILELREELTQRGVEFSKYTKYLYCLIHLYSSMT